jgi:DNA polymerase-3 subunit gamma/tau
LDVLGAVDDGIFAQMLSAITERNVTQALSKVEEIAVQGRDLTQFVADFLWFLRNLMLVKTSDIPAERLEISRESLDRLKAISEKVDLNIIMRYIRVLSSLSADMKYSDQKRVLLEVAIIRMCKPQMETDTDSLAERIRDLEKNYTTAQVIPLSAGAVPMVNMAQPVIKQKPRRDKALPEEVRKVLASWESIRETIENPLQNYLGDCKLSINDDDVLLIVPTNPFAGKYLQREGMMDQVRETINESVGKEVPTELKILGEEEEFGDHFVDIKKMFGDLVIKDDTI